MLYNCEKHIKFSSVLIEWLCGQTYTFDRQTWVLKIISLASIGSIKTLRDIFSHSFIPLVIK